MARFQMRGGLKQSLGYWYLSKMEWFSLLPNLSKLSKSEPTYPHSILMQKSKDMREKKIEPEIYRDVKVTNNGYCVLDHDLLSAYRCHVTE